MDAYVENFRNLLLQCAYLIGCEATKIATVFIAWEKTPSCQASVSVLNGGFHENLKVYNEVFKARSFVTWASSCTFETEHTLHLAIGM